MATAIADTEKAIRGTKHIPTNNDVSVEKKITIKTSTGEILVDENKMEQCQFYRGVTHFNENQAGGQKLNIGNDLSPDEIIVFEILNSGKMVPGEYLIEDVLVAADRLGAFPVIELCQLQMLEDLFHEKRSEPELILEQLQSVLGIACEPSKTLKERCKKYLDEFTQSAISAKDWKMVERIFQFGQENGALELFMKNFDIKTTILKASPQLVEFAFKFNLPIFRHRMQRSTIYAFSKRGNLAGLLKHYHDFPNAYGFIRSRVIEVINADNFSWLRSFASLRNDKELLEACDDFATQFPEEVEKAWLLGSRSVV